MKLVKKKAINHKFLFITLIIFNFVFGSLSIELFSSQKIILKDANDKKLSNDFYLLGPGDTVSLNIFDAPEFNGEYKILRDGTVTFPLIGTININNLTLNQAIEKTQDLYKKELLRPELFLNIVFPRPITFSVIGEVERPGIYTFSTPERTFTNDIPKIPTKLVNGIREAGGITQNANLKMVTILRKLPGNKNEYKKINNNLLDLIYNGNHINNPMLFDGDIIKISKVNSLPSELMTIANANFSPQTIKVSVIGKVENPGSIEVSPNTPLNQAILLAGGPLSWKANKGNVELFRVNKDGSAFRKKFKINLSQSISDEYNPPLMNRDIIKVNSSSINSLGEGIATITNPLSGLVTAFTLIKLTQD